MSFNYGSTSIKINIFQEAMDHCRWKRQLDTVLLRPELHDNILQDYSGKSFEEILLTVYNICEQAKGVGLLTIYDITAAICRYNNINIERVYIIGRGPVRAARLLNIKLKTQKIQKVSLKYIEISEIIEAFENQKYEIDSHIKQSSSGDDFETYICNWQKDK
jgi:hypothetical protein